MSAPRSKQTILIKKFGKMAEEYQEKINRQAAAMTRMTKALSQAHDTLYSVQHEARDIRQARKLAKDGAASINRLLEAESGEGNE